MNKIQINFNAGRNLLDEKIPDWEALKNSDGEVFKTLEDTPKYAFSDLFIGKKAGWYAQNLISSDQNITFPIKGRMERQNEIAGLYLFYEEETPLYVGISRRLIKRLRDHFLSKSHFSSSLVYLMARHEFESEKGYYMGQRKDFTHFHDKREGLQELMRENWNMPARAMPD